MHDRMIGIARSLVRSIVFVTVVVVASLAGCSSSDTTKPGGVGALSYGALVNPKPPYDPFLTEAYRTLAVDHNQVGHLVLSWGSIQRGDSSFDWSFLDRHIQKAVPAEIKLSVAIELIHGGEADVPAYRWPDFPGWDDSTLQASFVGFLRAVERRFPERDSTLHTLKWLWIGEGPDRFAAAFPGDDAAMLAFYDAVADSARRIFPHARIGTIITPAGLQETHGEPLVRQLRSSLDVIGLSVFPEDLPGGLQEPEEALQTMAAWITPWEDRPVAVLEAGYPSSGSLGSSEVKQTDFAGLLAAWLRSRPATLELFCWSPLFDMDADLADSLSFRRFPAAGDTTLRADFARRIASMSLHRIDGTNKPARQTWMEARP